MTPEDIREQVFTLLQKLYPWTQPELHEDAHVPLYVDWKGARVQWIACLSIRLRAGVHDCVPLELRFLGHVESTFWTYPSIWAVHRGSEEYKVFHHVTKTNGAIKSHVWRGIQKLIVDHCSKVPFESALDDMGLLKPVRSKSK